VFYHKLGTSAAADDQLVYEAGAENAKWLLSCQSTDDYETLLVSVLSICVYYSVIHESSCAVGTAVVQKQYSMMECSAISRIGDCADTAAR
jgi:Prolyl oligopeptidase, N-terminal beta-propeller domain